MFQCSASRLTSRYSSAVDAAGRTDSTPLRHSRIPGSVADSRVVFPDDGLRRRGLAVVPTPHARTVRGLPPRLVATEPRQCASAYKTLKTKRWRTSPE